MSWLSRSSFRTSSQFHLFACSTERLKFWSKIPSCVKFIQSRLNKPFQIPPRGANHTPKVPEIRWLYVGVNISEGASSKVGNGSIVRCKPVDIITMSENRHSLILTTCLCITTTTILTYWFSNSQEGATRLTFQPFGSALWPLGNAYLIFNGVASLPSLL